MSESMAFIGGVAVAGLAAILLLKGTGGSLQQPNIAIPQIPNLVPQQQTPYYQPYPALPQPSPVSPNADERVAIERVKMENDILKRENDQLKAQVQQMQAQMQQACLQLSDAIPTKSKRRSTVAAATAATAATAISKSLVVFTYSLGCGRYVPHHWWWYCRSWSIIFILS
jgi:hypothetical protein